MESGKFVGLVILAALIMVSVPLPTIGAGVVNAVDFPRAFGSPPADGGTCLSRDFENRCILKGGRYGVGRCVGAFSYSWHVEQTLYLTDIPTQTSLSACYDYCKNNYAQTCREPYIDSSSTVADGTNVPVGQTVTVTYSRNPNLQNSVIGQPLKITFKLSNEPTSYVDSCQSASCQKPFIVGNNLGLDVKAGDTLHYWIDMSLTDGTYIRSPASGVHSFTFASGATPPTNPPAQGKQRLAVTKTGTGTVTSNPPGINCGNTCTFDFNTGTPVTLTANPDTGQTFSGWSGGCTGTGICQVIMNGQKNVAAAFSSTTPPGTTGTITMEVLGQTVVGGSVMLRFRDLPANADPGRSQLEIRDPGGLRVYNSFLTSTLTQGEFDARIAFTPRTQGEHSVILVVNNNAGQRLGELRDQKFTVAAAGTTPAGQCNSACIGDGFGSGRCENTPLSNPQATSSAGGYGCPSTQYCNCYSTSAPPGTPGAGCCAVKEVNTYNSENSIRTRDECSRQGGVWGSTCDQAHNSACNQFCSGNGYGTAGTCNPAGTSSFTNICLNPTTPCVCTGTGQLRNTNIPCRQACSTDTRVSSGYGYGGYGYPGYSSPVVQSQAAQIPFGQGTNNPEALRFAWMASTQTTGTSGQYVREPFPLSQIPGQYQCGDDEFCVCTFLSLSSFSATNPSPVRNTPGSIQWDAPDAIPNPPVKQPNQRDCTVAANATITAMFAGNQTVGAGAASPTRLIQAGDSVTITGNVGKLSDSCEGYTYTCRKEKIIPCDTHNRVLWTSLSAEDCPAGTTLVNDPQEGRTANWRTIVGIALIAASFTPCDGACMSAGISSIIDGAVAGLNCDSGRTPQSNALLYYSMLQQVQERSSQNNPNNQGGGANLNFCCSQNDNAFCEDNSKRGTGYCIGSSVSCPNRYTKRTCPGTNTNANQNANTGGNNNADIDCVNPSEYCSLDGNCNAGSQEECWIGGTQGTCCSYSPTGAAVASNAGTSASAANNAAKYNPYAIAATVALSQIPICPSAEDQQECFSVCGSTYTTNVSAAPVCQGPVIGYQDARYKCLPGTCGGYDNKQVKILVKGPDGSTAIDDTTTTDSNGDFSYTFIAPGADGEFTIIASVPRS